MAIDNIAKIKGILGGILGLALVMAAGPVLYLSRHHMRCSENRMETSISVEDKHIEIMMYAIPLCVMALWGLWIACTTQRRVSSGKGAPPAPLR
jgi:hypothetical protein